VRRRVAEPRVQQMRFGRRQQPRRQQCRRVGPEGLEQQPYRLAVLNPLRTQPELPRPLTPRVGHLARGVDRALRAPWICRKPRSHHQRLEVPRHLAHLVLVNAAWSGGARRKGEQLGGQSLVARRRRCGTCLRRIRRAARRGPCGGTAFWILSCCRRFETRRRPLVVLPDGRSWQRPVVSWGTASGHVSRRMQLRSLRHTELSMSSLQVIK
jgi:hypothetical protein